jgi:integrase
MWYVACPMDTQRQLFPPEELERLQNLRTFLSRSVLAENTITGYRYDWSMFSAFCGQAGRTPLPTTSDTVSLYITHILDHGTTIKTARRRICAIAHYHRQAGFQSPCAAPTVKTLLCGATRQRLEQPDQKEPLQIDQLRRIADILLQRDTAAAARDLAILVIGFASALRRSNIAALGLDDVEFRDEGVILTVHREKQDQEGVGRFIALPKGTDPRTCSATCLRAWLAQRGKLPGRLFTRLDRGRVGLPMDAEAIAKIVKRSVALIGLNPTRYGAHSLRAGFVTEAAENGVSDTLIASHTGHRSTQSLRFYYRRRRLWTGNAASMIGL